jgi:hypothetical protein
VLYRGVVRARFCACGLRLRFDLIRPVIGRPSCTRLVSRVSLPTTLSFVKGLLADERQLGPEIFF